MNSNKTEGNKCNTTSVYSHVNRQGSAARFQKTRNNVCSTRKTQLYRVRHRRGEPGLSYHFSAFSGGKLVPTLCDQKANNCQAEQLQTCICTTTWYILPYTGCFHHNVALLQYVLVQALCSYLVCSYVAEVRKHSSESLGPLLRPVGCIMGKTLIICVVGCWL